MTNTKNNKKVGVSTTKVGDKTKKTLSTIKVDKVANDKLHDVHTSNKVDILKGMNLPPVETPKVPQHIVCMELAKLGYKAKQVSEITNIKLTNVSWYFSKYKLNELVKQFHESQKK